MRPTDLRDFVTLYTVTVANDVETVTKVADLWAQVRPIGGRERAAAGALGTTMTYRVTVAYRTLAESSRFVWGSRTLEVNSVYDPDGDRHWLVCECTERV